MHAVFCSLTEKRVKNGQIDKVNPFSVGGVGRLFAYLFFQKINEIKELFKQIENECMGSYQWSDAKEKRYDLWFFMLIGFSGIILIYFCKFV